MDETPRASIKLQTITKRINRLLQDKYNLTDSIHDRKTEQISQRDTIPHEQLVQAYEKTERMTIKLKQIRTLLGYQLQSKTQLKKSTEKKKEERAINLKNFVLSMRKRNQTIKQSEKIGSLFSKEINNLGSEDPALQQYTDASLKYINSFLPHQTFVDYQVNRQRKTYSQAQHKQLKKSNELKPEELREVQQLHMKLLESPQRNAQILGIKDTKDKNSTQIIFSPMTSKWQSNIHHNESRSNKKVSAFCSQKSNHQAFNKYLTINIDSPRDSYVKQKDISKRMASPLDFLAGKTIQYSHKSKAKYTTNKRCWDSRTAKPQTRDTIKKIVPVILPCIPKQRDLI